MVYALLMPLPLGRRVAGHNPQPEAGLQRRDIILYCNFNNIRVRGFILTGAPLYARARPVTKWCLFARCRPSTLIRLHAAPRDIGVTMAGTAARMAADRVVDNVLGTPNMGVWQDGGNRVTR